MKKGMLAASLVAGLLLGLGQAACRADDSAADDVLEGHSYHGQAFNEGPRQKARLMEGSGKVSFPVTSSNALAQQFINQGVGQLHGFWYFEAERSFRQAAAIDPQCAMAYWGMAMANLDNRDRARGFIDEAVKRADNVSDREQLYIDALNTFLEPDPEDKQAEDSADETDESDEPPLTAAELERERSRCRAFVDAWEEILYEYPDDIEAKAFLAVQLWKNVQRDIPITSHFAVDALLKQVLAVEPMHPCHHYRIHLWDRKKPEMALDSAALCGQSAPAIAHMWHMPGHIYSRLHRYSDAAWHQEASARVDHAYMNRDRVMPDQIHNYAHNNEWLVRDLSNVGRVHDAIDLAKNMIELPRHPKYNKLSKHGSAYYGRRRLMEVLARHELWDDLIALSQTPYLDTTDDEEQEALRSYFLGQAYFRSGDREQGEQQLQSLQTQLDDYKASHPDLAPVTEPGEKNDDADPGRESPTADRSKLSKREKEHIKWMDESIRELQGLSAISNGDVETGIGLLKKCPQADKSYLAFLLLEDGQTEAAIRKARGFARDKPKEAQPLAQLVTLLWSAGEKEAAGKAFKRLLPISGPMDLDVPLFAKLKPIAKELGYSEDFRVPLSHPDDFGPRPDLDSLGPFRWHAWQAPEWSLPDANGKLHSLAEYHGRPVLMIFFLGSGCLHCAEQLQAFAPMAEEYEKAGITLIGVSSDDRRGLQVSLDNYSKGQFPFPLISDESQDVFKSYRSYDGFEEMVLHGTFLIDGNGMLRWQDISYEPFMEPEFLLKEAQRLLSQDSGGKPSDQTASGTLRNK